MKLGYIYKITNKITGQIYIGKTKNILKRETVYKNVNCKSQRFIYKSLKHFGWENHKFEVIYKTIYNENRINEIEIFFIDFFKSYYYSNKKYGLNLTIGGNNVFDRKINPPKYKSTPRKSYKHTEETKIKLSLARQNLFKDPEFKKIVIERLLKIPQYSILSEKDVLTIIERINNNEKLSLISKDFKTSTKNISEIKSGRSWKKFTHLIKIKCKVRKSPKYFSLEDIENIIYLKNIKKYTLKEIAEIYNIDKKRIWLILKKNINL